MKGFCNQLPDPIQAVGDGRTRFLFDIEEVEGGFSFREVIISGAVSSAKLTAACIDELWGDGVEQKIINDHNEFTLLGDGNADATAIYIEFLTKRKALKQYIKSVLNEAI